MLNNRPYYQRLLLDQGYWPESLLTAPTDEDYIKDINLVKQMGFNGVRKHQKVEDPRFLYHADKMGLLVWGEIGSAYVYTRRYAQNMVSEWMEVIKRDYNHPCIVVWTPINESWGIHNVNANIAMSSHCKALYHVTKSIDSTRLVVSNDGWEHTDSDLLTIHDYEWREEVLQKRYESIDSIVRSMPAGRLLYVEGNHYEGQPIMVTEFGGISYRMDETENEKAWGYSVADTDKDFIERYRAVVLPLTQSPHVQGFCYTQLTDVEQETNGLLTYERKPKVDLEIIAEITQGISKDSKSSTCN
jgi:beta-galactosidase/beta-glucuronidase